MFMNRARFFNTIPVLSRQNVTKTISATLDKTNTVKSTSAISVAPPYRKLSCEAMMVLGVGVGAVSLTGIALGHIMFEVVSKASSIFNRIFPKKNEESQEFWRNQFHRELIEQNQLLMDQSQALENIKKGLENGNVGQCIGSKKLDDLVKVYKMMLEHRSKSLATQFSSEDKIEQVVKIVQDDCFSLCSDLIKALKTSVPKGGES